MTKYNNLNLGCGHRYHSQWTNIDFVSNSKYVQRHNLLKGIPFNEKSFDVVYHSHVLEHFSKKDGISFIKECYRVLKSNGIIRIAVPDLEVIIQEYQKNLKGALSGDVHSHQNYEWIMLELYDQTLRNRSGGEMMNYLLQEKIPNEEYVFNRIGEEGRNIKKQLLNKKNNSKFIDSLKQLVIELKSGNFFLFKTKRAYYNIGKFRLGGEIHQWMYDRYSLTYLLKQVGFSDITITDASTSKIPNWSSFELDSKDNVVFKPDSLFIEAIKK